MNDFCTHLGAEIVIQSFTAFDIFKIKITNMAASGPLRSINISGDRARILSPVNDLSPKT